MRFTTWLSLNKGTISTVQKNVQTSHISPLSWTRFTHVKQLTWYKFLNFNTASLNFAHSTQYFLTSHEPLSLARELRPTCRKLPRRGGGMLSSAASRHQWRWSGTCTACYCCRPHHAVLYCPSLPWRRIATPSQLDLITDKTDNGENNNDNTDK